MFGLAILFTYFTYKDVKTFFIFLTIFNAFVVWGGLLDLWTLIVNIIILCLIIIQTFKKGRVV